MEKLIDFYKNHTGKLSDKWALYLREYDRVLDSYRAEPISILEIGVQNGGSLEIWSKYFPCATKIVGCDINQDCAKLMYDDPRIVLIVGDATTVETEEKVLKESNSFDLIIEDGSHRSGDIIKAFAKYFPVLREGGLFIAEDLHCSYWNEYEGGIYYPYSSINFFKFLADIVNYEHWGIERSRSDIISGFKEKFQVEISDDLLSTISSVEFVNSVCVIKKLNSKNNELGVRVVCGEDFIVEPEIHGFANMVSSPLSQADNKWSVMAKSPAEKYEELLEVIETGRQNLINAQVQYELLNAENGFLINSINQIKASHSWRYTASLRVFATKLRSIAQYFKRP